jgi:hypothetical protein
MTVLDISARNFEYYTDTLFLPPCVLDHDDDDSNSLSSTNDDDDEHPTFACSN